MAETYVIDPDLDFIKEVGALGGEDLKKCYQCATCSVACPISPDTKPFPRKEMIAASWGLKDKLVGNSDIWLCHNSGDCSTRCPREAKPGDVLAAVRSYTISEYAQPKALAQALKDPKKLPISCTNARPPAHPPAWPPADRGWNNRRNCGTARCRHCPPVCPSVPRMQQSFPCGETVWCPGIWDRPPSRWHTGSIFLNPRRPVRPLP